MLSTWWRGFTKRQSQRLARRGRPTGRVQARSFRPELTTLEERCLLAVFTGTNFVGISQNSMGEPPDSIAAAGPNYIVELVNGSHTDASGATVAAPQIAFLDKVLGGVVFQQDFTTFFKPVNPGPFIFDPFVTFDEQAPGGGRFLLGAIDRVDANSQGFIDFAVSNDSNPNHGFSEMHRFEVTELDNTTGELLWGDFPRLGWNQDAYVLSVNMFPFAGAEEGGFNHVQVINILKSSVLDGDAGSLTAVRGIDVGDGVFTLTPTVMHDSVPGGPMWFVTETPTQDPQHTSVRLIRMTDLFNPAPTLLPFDLSVPAYGEPVPPTQPNGKSPVPEKIDSRILNASLRGNELVATHNVGTGDGGVTQARWYQFDLSNDVPTLVQSGDIAHGRGVSTFFPSIEIATNGDLGMTFMESSKQEVMSMYVTGRTPSDPLGVMQTPKLVKSGETNYQGGRAGDYSGISVDPTNTTTFWAVNEFAAQVTALDNWGTWIANFSVFGLDPNSLISRNRDFLAQAYRDILNRQIDPSGLAFFDNLLALGTSREQVALLLTNSQEYRAKVIKEQYLAILGRSADAAGLNFYLQFLDAGNTIEQLKASLLGSDEFFVKKGGGTNQGWLSALYKTVLGRSIDSFGQLYLSQLLALKLPRSQVAYPVVTSGEAETKVVGDYYKLFLRRDADSAGLAFFVSLLQKGAQGSQPIVVSDAPKSAGLRDEQVISMLVGSDEYFRPL